MPFRNEHSARLREPGDFDPSTYRRTEGGTIYGRVKVPATISIIWGKLKGKIAAADPVLPQSLRFKKDDWTAEKAKAWLETNGVKYVSFEPAQENAPEPDLKESQNMLVIEGLEVPFEKVIVERMGPPGSSDEQVYITGPFVEADKKNGNGRIYPSLVVDDIIAQIKDDKKTYIGADGHGGGLFGAESSYRDVAMRIDTAWRDGDIGKVRFKLISTAAGRDLKVVALEGIPIGLSMAGRGEQAFDEERDAYIIRRGYELVRIDAVLDPACDIAQAMKESKNHDTKKEVHVDPLQQAIAALTESVSAIKTELGNLTKKIEGKAAELPADALQTLEKMRAELKKGEDRLEAKKKIQAILDNVEEMKPIESFRAVAVRQLESCASPAEVEIAWPRVKGSLLEMVGQSQAPAPKIQVIHENGLFGASRPKTPAEVYTTILNRFKDNGLWPDGNLDLENVQSFAHMDNPRWVAKTLIDNYLKLYVRENKFFANSPRNPLRWLTETAGDDEFYTGDVTQTAAALLPLYVVVLEDWMAMCNQAFGTLPLSAPQGKVFFQNEYYNTGTGTWSKIDRTNFLYSKGQKAEGAAGQIIKIKFESDTINLETALKFLAEWTPEAMQDAMAYYRTSIENPHVQAMKNETLRSISYQVISKLLTMTSCAHNDAIVQAPGSPMEFSLTPDLNWTGGDWIKIGFTRFIKQLDALILDRDADTIIIPKALRYLFSAPEFVADAAAPTTYGFTRIGTYQASYKVFVSNIPTLLDNTIAMLHRGGMVTDAAHLFLPYILFYLGNLVDAADGSQSRLLMSRFAIQKVWGGRCAFGTVVP